MFKNKSEEEIKRDHLFCPIKIENNKVVPDTPFIYKDLFKNKTYSNKTHVLAMLQFITKK